VGGEFATGIDIFWREEKPWIVIRLTSGRRTSIPAAWTDLTIDPRRTDKNRSEILPSGLLEMARHCRELLLATRQPRTSKKKARHKA
jgi:hypothetical protein